MHFTVFASLLMMSTMCFKVTTQNFVSNDLRKEEQITSVKNKEPLKQGHVLAFLKDLIEFSGNRIPHFHTGNSNMHLDSEIQYADYKPKQLHEDQALNRKLKGKVSSNTNKQRICILNKIIENISVIINLR